MIGVNFCGDPETTACARPSLSLAQKDNETQVCFLSTVHTLAHPLFLQAWGSGPLVRRSVLHSGIERRSDPAERIWPNSQGPTIPALRRPRFLDERKAIEKKKHSPVPTASGKHPLRYTADEQPRICLGNWAIRPAAEWSS